MAGDEPDPKKPKSIQDISNMTSKQYLDQLVVPQLLPALNAVSTNRPSDPIQYLVRPLETQHTRTTDLLTVKHFQAEYLLKNRGTEDVAKPAESSAEQKD